MAIIMVICFFIRTIYNSYEEMMYIGNINYKEIRYEREQLKMIKDQLFSLRAQEKKNIQMIHDRCQEIIMDKVEDEIRHLLLEFHYKHLNPTTLQRCMIY